MIILMWNDSEFYSTVFLDVSQIKIFKITLPPPNSVKFLEYFGDRKSNPTPTPSIVTFSCEAV